MTCFRRSLGALALLSLTSPALASFHLMQIELAVGGVGNDATQQAVQLRMRAGGQNQVTGTQIIAYDASGANPVTLVQFPSAVSNSSGGSRILIASAKMVSEQGVAPDATMTALIPAGYLPAGRLTFQNGSTIYWSLCWGGAGYTGSTTGSMTNDTDGEFGPCFAGPLPSATDVTLRFPGASSAQSTNNAADYALSASPGSLISNAGSTFGLSDDRIFRHGFED
ncbi:MAG: hypothetical protein KDJ14_13180 [Xanthomonadales bacterium]|nr:hypothetical protein [Xanthomonadales bacterium]